MSKGGLDIFVLIIHFLNHNWELDHVTIRLLETAYTYGATMAIQVNEMLATYGLNAKILACVKYENNNLTIMTTTLTFIVSCKELKLITPFILEHYWGHAMSKCC
jgi:hypothetical protein